MYVHGQKIAKMHAKQYYHKFALTKGLKIATKSLKYLQKNYDIVILEGAGSPAEINLQKFDIANMKIAEQVVLLFY